MTEKTEIEQEKNIIQHLIDQGFNLRSTIKNKYDLTEEEQIALVQMTPKEKKKFLKERNAQVLP